MINGLPRTRPCERFQALPACSTKSPCVRACQRRVSERPRERLLARGPDAPGDVGDESELGRLLLGGEGVAGLAGSEAALRAQGQSLERNVSRGVLDALLHRPGVFELTALGGDEA